MADFHWMTEDTDAPYIVDWHTGQSVHADRARIKATRKLLKKALKFLDNEESNGAQ